MKEAKGRDLGTNPIKQTHLSAIYVSMTPLECNCGFYAHTPHDKRAHHFRHQERHGKRIFCHMFECDAPGMWGG